MLIVQMAISRVPVIDMDIYAGEVKRLQKII